MYDLSKELHIQYFEKDGQTQYYSRTMTERDVREIDSLVREWDKEFFVENTTIEETDTHYLVWLASVDRKQVDTGRVYKGKKVVLQYGRYGNDLEKVIPCLERAQAHAESEVQKKMLAELILFYRTGEMKHHLEYSKHWVLDQNPRVETYQGFIETYRDPQGVRAEMEGFVATVDPDVSASLEKLLDPRVTSDVLGRLPVPQFLHRETFTPPTYKAIDIIAFVTSGFPIGINIPNYDAIRQSFGFKNVTLQNVINARLARASDVQYVEGDETKARLLAQMRRSMNCNTALHELYGHGSCRLIFEADYEALAPGEKELLHGYYRAGDTFYGTFKELQSCFEECRAEVTAHFLASDPYVMDIFGIPAAERADYVYATAYDTALSGLLGLMQYDDKTGSWLQAHSRANHLILRNVLARTDAIRLEFNDKEDYVHIVIDESRIGEVRDAHGWLVNKLNVLKSGADIGGSEALFGALTEVDSYWAKVRAICIAHKRPRMVYLPAVVTGGEAGYMIEDV